MTSTPPEMTPAQLFALLLSELSASGSVALPAEDPSKPNLTLREAVAAILWKNTTELSLKGRPRNPNLADDLYGHILNLRAETLQNQALLAALCQANHINVVSILNAVKESF